MSVPEICKQCGRLAFAGDTVTIPRSEYLELRKLQSRAVADVEINLIPFRQFSRSPIARHPEMAAFIWDSRNTMMMHEIVDACRERFGESVAPSRTAVHRFLHQVMAGRLKAR